MNSNKRNQTLQASSFVTDRVLDLVLPNLDLFSLHQVLRVSKFARSRAMECAMTRLRKATFVVRPLINGTVRRGDGFLEFAGDCSDSDNSISGDEDSPAIHVYEKVRDLREDDFNFRFGGSAPYCQIPPPNAPAARGAATFLLAPQSCSRKLSSSCAAASSSSCSSSPDLAASFVWDSGALLEGDDGSDSEAGGDLASNYLGQKLRVYWKPQCEDVMPKTAGGIFIGEARIRPDCRDGNRSLVGPGWRLDVNIRNESTRLPKGEDDEDAGDDEDEDDHNEDEDDGSVSYSGNVKIRSLTVHFAILVKYAAQLKYDAILRISQARSLPLTTEEMSLVADIKASALKGPPAHDLKGPQTSSGAEST